MRISPVPFSTFPSATVGTHQCRIRHLENAENPAKRRFPPSATVGTAYYILLIG